MAVSSSGSEAPLGLYDIENSLEGASYTAPVLADSGKSLARQFVRHVAAWAAGGSSSQAADTAGQPLKPDQESDRREAIKIGLAALGAFLQANVTGPVLERSSAVEATFRDFYEEFKSETGATDVSRDASFTSACLRWLDTDGVSVYQYIPHIELFGLARFIFASGAVLPLESADVWAAGSDDDLASHLAWTRFRIHLWHYKLLTQPSLSAGSIFTKSGRWTDVGTLQEKIETSMHEAQTSLDRTVTSSKDGSEEEKHLWSQGSRVQFYLEKTNCHIMLGNDVKAREALKTATEVSGFTYLLSGALGKRTRFQENNISQLVVLAKSRDEGGSEAEAATEETAPSALALNDDTLLEQIKFSEEKVVDLDSTSESALPAQLRGLSPENQPKLLPEDQIILLAEATLRDSFSPADSLTSQEVLPFAVRVVEDKSTNWQIYTQALLVRSRIELARSRTVERGVLQMQAVVDQVVVDTEAPAPASTTELTAEGDDVPSIRVTSDANKETNIVNKPTSFLPAAKPTESASPQERLRFVNALSSPPRWHLECELAYAWTSVGSLVSAMEIFKRLRLWPEIALCLATQGSMDDEDGRGSGGEEKARALLRWRLFRRTGSTDGDDGYDEQSDRLEDPKFDFSTLKKAADWTGPERSPPPPNAPRLLCILGDIENDPAHYQRAWDISKRRFARAQRSLGELCLQRQDHAGALAAYRLAVGVNRVSNELWSRVGDLELRLGNFPDAAEAFQRAISTANSTSGGDDARTWSNLGSALLSWYREVLSENRGDAAAAAQANQDNDDERDVDDNKQDAQFAAAAAAISADNKPSTRRAAELGKPAYKLLQESLAAFKRGATIAHSNWRIWDNVVTLAASLVPKPAVDDVVLGVQNVLRIRKTEDALDIDVLTLLLREVTSNTPAPPAGGGDDTGVAAVVYTPARGSLEHKVVRLFEDDIVPLLTARAEVWSLISRLRAWRRDFAGAMDASEKSWRAAIGGVGAGSASLSAATTTAAGDAGNWLTDPEQWDAVVARTEELVAAYENYGSRTDEVGSRWKGKARSAVRSVMGKARESWEGSERWKVLEGLMDELKL
ncbi:tetratricopeptide repeat protein 27 [Microdochium nivale]|nr:tetratricopeptide repeat protein 27 [Microdochium nivale]